jgi:hypothetical protein
VQDAFTRLMAATNGEIQDERGWLIVVTSRLTGPAGVTIRGHVSSLLVPPQPRRPD